MYWKPHILTNHSFCNDLHVSYNMIITISIKIFGVHFQQNMNWDDHTTELSKTCYATLSALGKMKGIAPFNIRKHLCESQVLSKFDYCSSVFDPFVIIQQRRLQKIQNSCAALIFTRYWSASDALSLGGLPTKECTEMRIASLCYQALHNKKFSDYLKLNLASKKRLLRACNDHGTMVEISGHRNSFTSKATNLFNALPKNIRQLNKENTFKSETIKYF